ncbi:MAG: hypothetical protein M1830_010464 [Pleopsidium flavum]|nr:MAG: hypothetical protein M1830_010464 [Pleopsidium flavum]
MKFLKHMRSKSRLKNNGVEAQIYNHHVPPAPATNRPSGHDGSARLPAALLEKIFSYICPHTRDNTYNSSEESMMDDGCMLCEMRDLAQCALVCRQWAEVAQHLLYHSVRIDAVHYCEREVELAKSRKRRSFFERNGDPKDAPQQRLQLFSRTVRGDESLAVMVQFLKMPYMTRETCKADLARTVSVLPNLRYVDLPEGFYNDEPSSNTLKQELQARCPNLRKMRYHSGSEPSFTGLAQSRHWQCMEILELSHLMIEPSTLLYVLDSFPALHQLKIVDAPWLDDSILQPTPSLPLFPPLQSLSIENAPNLTAMGLKSYLSRPETREILSMLSLNSTGVLPCTLHLVLANAPHLAYLSIVDTVSHPFPAEPSPPLTSRSLTTLYFEIFSSPSAYSMQPLADSYYTYLTNSLLSNSLPSLRALYVRSNTFPETLLAPPAPAFAPRQSNGLPRGLSHPLSVYSKGLDELDWNLTSIFPPTAPGRRGSASATRPISAYSALSLTSGGDSRHSSLVGNGFGGFLAVPSDDGGRIGSASGKKGHGRGSKTEAWMG